MNAILADRKLPPIIELDAVDMYVFEQCRNKIFRARANVAIAKCQTYFFSRLSDKKSQVAFRGK